ncbi:Pentatricopeptide repeat-containing protein [Melia azedarach]|uniref:Pentatricopeptide repeat-containing protein n=1 Tax=Melia azedarach TaxID=155640 RepID=A0ACC1X5J2_MELAZ|nr:Pentatricopeptide repeat-containing protein [Melia azedarach]
MIVRKPSSHFLFKTRRRAITTCTLQVDPPANITSSSPSTSNSYDHKMFCLSLAEELIKRGSISSARQVIHRIIANSASISDAISAADLAILNGMDLGLGGYGALLRKLLESGESQLALSLYQDNIVALGIDPDPSILNSIIICLCKLGNVEDAIRHSDRLLSMNSLPIKPASDAILRELCAEERVLEAFDYFIKISDAGVALNCCSYNVLIDGLCFKGYLNEAMEVFDIMGKRKRLPPTLHQYKSLFYGFCKKRRIVEAELLSKEMESLGFYVDKTMYTSLINGYCRDKKMTMAMRVYFRMLKMGCEPDSYACNTLIHGFAKMGLFDKGWALYSQMTYWGLQPNVVTYHIMISNYCRKGKIDCALMLLNNMVSSKLVPSVHCYTVVIAALYKQNRLTEIDELYKNMLDNGVAPDHILSFILMKKCPKGRELQLALMLLQAFAKNGCGIDPLALSKSATRDFSQEIELLLGEIVKSNPNLANVAFGIYINALCKVGRAEEAFLCLDKMVSFGCRPLHFTCNCLIKCLCLEGLFEDAKSLIVLMQDSGMVADAETYLILVTEHCKWRNLDSAFDLLDQMEAEGPKPGVAIYDTIIGCLFREKKILEAQDVFKRMLEAGVDPDEVVYTTMINGYSQNGKAIEAGQLFEKMIENSIQPSSHSYTALISGLVKKGMMDKGCIYLSKMFGDGLVPNAVLYTSLISHFLRKGEFEFAFRLVDLMDRNQIEYDLITYIALVSGVCRHITVRKIFCDVNRGAERAREMLFQLLHQRTLAPREKDIRVSADSPEAIECFALKLVRKVKAIQFMPNLYLYNGIISGFCWAGRMHDAYDHFQMMQREGVRPNQVTFTILIHGHILAGEIDHAIGLFNQMNADGCVADGLAYNTLLRGLCQAGRLHDALSVLYTMRKRGYIPNKDSYENLLGGLCANCWSIPAFKIFEEMIAHGYLPYPYSYNWLLCILCKEKQFHEAYMVFDVMRKRGKLLQRGFCWKHLTSQEKFS